MRNIAIVWFRNDLRLHDNEALTEALATHDIVIPVYVFDPRIFKGKTSYGFKKTGSFRTQFVLESLQDLRTSFREKGSDLFIREGHPEEVLFDLAKQYKCRAVYCNRERTSEEVLVQDQLENNLWTIGQEMRYNRGKMMYYTSDLPFPIAQTPDTFTTFRKEVEKIVPVRLPLSTPVSLKDKNIEGLEAGEIPSLQDFGYSINDSSPFNGGESAALKQVEYYLFGTDNIKNYKDTRNGMLGWDFSSKLSPWLAQGCLSPKYIYHQIKKYEEERQANKSTYWLFFELLWRDFFRLMGKKHGNNIFKQCGTKGEHLDEGCSSSDLCMFRIWAEGRTGIPLIDANMRELNTTGFMSNRGRQNVASFLVKDLGMDWLLGAEYFESLLIDYDPCSNYGNWNYIAGVGSDQREDRYFNPMSQSKKYDSDGAYIKHWIPELSNVPSSFVYKPWEMSEQVFEELGLTLGKEYPKPAIDTSKWA